MSLDLEDKGEDAGAEGGGETVEEGAGHGAGFESEVEALGFGARSRGRERFGGSVGEEHGDDVFRVVF